MSLQEQNQDVAIPQVQDVSVGFSSAEGFDILQRIANVFAKSDITPKAFKGNHANCMIGVEMAMRMQASPLMVLQNLYIVHGSPSWSSQFLIATFNQCGKFSALRYEFEGERNTDAWGCRAWAIEKSTGEKLVGTLVTIGMAKKEGWFSKNGSKWQTMPELMLQYRASAWFIRAYAPEIAMGLPTHEEAQDVYEMEQTGDVFNLVQPAPVEEEKQDVVDVEPTTKEKKTKKETPAEPQAEAYKPPKMISCPKNEEEVLETVCDKCDSRNDCPAHE